MEGVIRCHVGKDSSPRGVAVHSLGWVTAAKDGELKLTPIKSDDGKRSGSPTGGGEAEGENSANDPASLPWSLRLRSKLEAAQIDPSFSRLNAPPSSMRSGGDSMASRIANMRLEKNRRKCGAEGPQTDEAPAPAPAPSKPVEEAKFVWTNSDDLNQMVESSEADTNEQELNAFRKYDTVEAKLGRLLNEKRIKLEDLMQEWDRNHDGGILFAGRTRDLPICAPACHPLSLAMLRLLMFHALLDPRFADISKQEFRLNVKKLGLDAPTQEMDELYDSLDLDGSGSLDLGEMKAALKKMQDDVRHVRESVSRVQAHVANMREVVALFKVAAKETEVVELHRRKLEAMRECARDGPATKVAATMKAKNVKIEDLVGQWDSLPVAGHISQNDFSRGFSDLDTGNTLDELRELFRKLDFDVKGVIDVEELTKMMTAAGARSTMAIQAARKAETVQLKHVTNAKAVAEAAQKAARAALSQAKAAKEAKEAAVREEKEAKEASLAKARAEEAATKKNRKGSTIATFMKGGV